MVQKKRNNVSINLDETSIKILKDFGYLDGRKNVVKGKNQSAFFNQLLREKAHSLYFNGNYDERAGAYMVAQQEWAAVQKEIQRLNVIVDCKMKSARDNLILKRDALIKAKVRDFGMDKAILNLKKFGLEEDDIEKAIEVKQ